MEFAFLSFLTIVPFICLTSDWHRFCFSSYKNSSHRVMYDEQQTTMDLILAINLKYDALKKILSYEMKRVLTAAVSFIFVALLFLSFFGAMFKKIR